MQDMTVAELIAELETFDPDMLVTYRVPSGNYWNEVAAVSADHVEVVKRRVNDNLSTCPNCIVDEDEETSFDTEDVVLIS